MSQNGSLFNFRKIPGEPAPTYRVVSKKASPALKLKAGGLVGFIMKVVKSETYWTFSQNGIWNHDNQRNTREEAAGALLNLLKPK